MNVGDPNISREKYRVWYRHSGMALPDEGWWKDVEFQTLSKEQITTADEGHTLTHLAITGGNVVDILSFAPQLTHISYQNLSTMQSSLYEHFESISKLHRLEQLNISGCDFSDGIPDTLFDYMKSLKRLSMPDCNLQTLPSSLSKLDKLEVLDISENYFSSHGVPNIFANMSSLRELRMNYCCLRTLPESLSNLGKLEVLDISANYFSSEGVLDIFTNMTSLKKLRMKSCKLKTLPESLYKLDKLEVLNISSNHFSTHGVPDLFTNMSALRELRMNFCRLRKLPESLSKLNKLEVLDISDNNFSSDGVSAIFTNMSSLRELRMNLSRLTTLPESLSKLVNLETLDISHNNFSSHGVPNIFTNMSSLRKLRMNYCDLTTLPESLSKLDKLEVLNLSDNYFSSLGVPDIFTNMSSLRQLRMTHCRLTSLPQSIGSLEQLRKLKLEDNEFERLPSLFWNLQNLQTLNLSKNRYLRSLDSKILHMKQLTLFSVASCHNLTSPPYEICRQGLPAIKQYFQDLAKGVGKNLPFATIAVIGNTMAGKTSLIRTLQSPRNARVLTKRSAKNGVDESTRVFNVEVVEVEDTVLRFIDLGGQEIYHITYQLTLRQKCIPVVVLSMKQYEEYKENENSREAVRRLAFDWISHLYLANPNLGPPKLVITHKDEFSETGFTALKDSFLTTTDILCTEIVKEETQLGGEFCKIEHFSDMSTPVFQSEDIYEIGNGGDYSVFNEIKNNLLQSSLNFVVTLPKTWEEVNEKILSLEAPFSSFIEIFDTLHKADNSIERNQLTIILTYMHDCGKLLWYENVKDLESYIFHKISEVTKLLGVLYNHDKSVREKRVKDFIPYLDCNQQRVELEDFEDLVSKFLATGIIDENLLLYLIKTETAFTRDTEVGIGVALLRSFRLLFGPLHPKPDKPCFIIPYFATGYCNLPDDPSNNLALQVDLHFKGWSLPRYVYHQMSIGVLDLFPDERDVPVVKQNGVVVFHNGYSIQLIHNYTSRSATIRVASAVGNISGCWDKLIDITNNVIGHILNTWKVSRVMCDCVCAHCLLLGKTHCQKKLNPNWCIRSSTSTQQMQITARQVGYTTTLCETEVIPSCLQYPCQSLSEQETQQLETAVKTMKQRVDLQKLRKDVVQMPDSTLRPTTYSDDDSDLSDGEGYLFPENDDSKIFIALEVKLTTKPRIKDLFSNTDKVYKMSGEVRGRALVINNDNFIGKERDGSDVDTKNVADMFKQFRMEVNDVFDLTAKEMRSEIISETQNKDHDDYQLFVLVIMTHGTDNDLLYGIDEEAVRLIDVLDLLSSQNFPQMAGKPKLIVIEACSGSREDFGDRVLQVPSSITSVGQPPPLQGGQTDSLNVDDLIVIKSSFPSYKSMRHPDIGTLFIRCLVTTLYKHACHRDVCELFEKVRERVRILSITLMKKELDKELKEKPQSEEDRKKYRKIFGQVPICFNTLTHGRKLYLFPGYDGKSSE